MSGTLVENGFNDLFQDYFFFQKKFCIIFFLIVVGDLLMEWSHGILNTCDTKLLIGSIVC